jgi:hypothetical protein
MNVLRLIGIAVIAWFCWRTFRGIQRSANQKERSLAIRGAVVFWILSAIFIGAMFALPAKGRLLLFIPLILVMGSAWKAYRNSRREIRDSANLDAKLQRMKKVN